MSNRWELTEQTATELETEAIALQKKHGIAAGALALILLSRDGSKADADMLSERVKVKTTNGKLEPFWAIAAFAQAVAHKPIRKEKKNGCNRQTFHRRIPALCCSAGVGQHSTGNL